MASRFQTLLFSIWIASASAAASAMEFKVAGDHLLMTGAVVDGDLARVRDAFAGNPRIHTVVLRNSFGGDAWTGYRIGEFFRGKGVSTIASGWCVSSCSRMFLGGVQRYFSDDFPAEQTYVGFHGHYRGDGSLNQESVNRMGLKSWTLKHAGAGLPPKMVEAWVELPRSTQTVNFYPLEISGKFGASVFECPVIRQTPMGCQSKEGDAKSLGIITDERLVSSFDQAVLAAAAQDRAARFPASGFANLEEISKLPLDLPAGIQNYRRFLDAPSPRAFAVSLNRQHWAWIGGGDEEVSQAALRRCEERAGQPCRLYAVDGAVVFKP